MNFIYCFGLLVFAYLLGSIPSGLVFTRIFTSVDIRQEGSKNIGATNVRRIAGTSVGLATLAGDVLKGVVRSILQRLCLIPAIRYMKYLFVLQLFVPFQGICILSI